MMALRKMREASSLFAYISIHQLEKRERSKQSFRLTTPVFFFNETLKGPRTKPEARFFYEEKKKRREKEKFQKR